MFVLVTCKFYEDQIKSEGDSVGTCFFFFIIIIVSHWEFSVVMAITILLECAPKPNSSLLPSQ